MLTRSPYTPPHLFLDNMPYFITGAIYQKRPLLAQSRVKETLLELIHETLAKYQWELHYWVILDNHYHWLGQSYIGKNLSKIIQYIHSRSAMLMSSLTQAEKPIWWNYWDYCPRNETDYFTRLNYLLNNPVKHGYVDNLHDYTWSTFPSLFAEVGRDALVQQFKTYPNYKNLSLSEANNDDF